MGNSNTHNLDKYKNKEYTSTNIDTLNEGEVTLAVHGNFYGYNDKVAGYLNTIKRIISNNRNLSMSLGEDYFGPNYYWDPVVVKDNSTKKTYDITYREKNGRDMIVIKFDDNDLRLKSLNDIEMFFYNKKRMDDLEDKINKCKL